MRIQSISRRAILVVTMRVFSYIRHLKMLMELECFPSRELYFIIQLVNWSNFEVPASISVLFFQLCFQPIPNSFLFTIFLVHVEQRYWSKSPQNSTEHHGMNVTFYQYKKHYVTHCSFYIFHIIYRIRKFRAAFQPRHFVMKFVRMFKTTSIYSFYDDIRITR